MRFWKLIVGMAIAAVALAGCLGPGTRVVTSTLRNGTASVGLWHAFGGNNCSWERLSSFSGVPADVIAKNLSHAGPQYVEIKADDVGFKTSGCVPWVQADGALDRKFPATASGQFPGDGEYRVGVEVPAGRYQATQEMGCHWVRESNFADENLGAGGGAIVDSVDVGIVDISATDVGFRSEHCGTWTKVTT